MKVKSVHLRQFKRFTDMKIVNISPAKLVILAGPNGCGKSSLFDAFYTWVQAYGMYGTNWDHSYHSKSLDQIDWSNNILLEFHSLPSNDHEAKRKTFYMRSAYRNDPDFTLQQLSRVDKMTNERRFARMIDSDAAVSLNYQRLTSQALEDVFVNESGSTTIYEFREKVLGDVRDAMRRIFPDLRLNDIGNPLANGTFRFDKGSARNFVYKNLSGGEKAAFDLILDLVVKRREFDDTVFCIDEPEAHMNTRLQGALLQ